MNKRFRVFLLSASAIGATLVAPIAAGAQTINDDLFPVASATTLLTSAVAFSAYTMLIYIGIVLGVVIVVGGLVWAYKAVKARFFGKGSLKQIK